MTTQNDAAQTLTDVIDPARARALQVTLGQASTIERGDALPAFFHHIYFWDPQPAEVLGPDGHPALGQFVPDLGLPRRMWAAGRLLFHGPMLAGVQADKTSMIEGVTQKQGRDGPLAFVRIRHDIKQRGAVVISEWQDLVYQEARKRPDEPRQGPAARTDESLSEEVAFDSTTLFRYSALTFNGHRIHYDTPYARRKEGYDGLVVHGPLLAQHLMSLAERQLGGPLTEVNYKATSPLTLPDTATLCWADGSAWVRGPDGVQCMEATIR
ncbi:MAG: MaoC family dehydratase N-terminal domain-containing protein [Pseudomonadota bacterium]